MTKYNVEKNNWERPIYFAITIGSSGRAFLYLDKYFQLDGMAYKFVPIKNTNNNTNTSFISQISNKGFGNFNELYKFNNLQQLKILFYLCLFRLNCSHFLGLALEFIFPNIYWNKCLASALVVCFPWSLDTILFSTSRKGFNCFPTFLLFVNY